MNGPLNPVIVIFDSNAYTRSLLREQLARIEDCCVQAHESGQNFDAAQLSASAVLMVLNHHVSDPAPFEFLQSFKLTFPQSYTVVICSPGLPRRALEVWQHDHAGIDAIFDKPIDLNKLSAALVERLGEIGQQHAINQQRLNLLRFLPIGALRRIFAQPAPGSAELFEMTVMFTDIRDSTRLIVQESARNYFARLNEVLASQAQLIRQYDGMVVKTTGDGLLAVFEGAARCHLALKCALAIQQSAQAQRTPVGIGMSDGLILTGILGTPEHVHFDVIGAHVHLAARLCARASQGEVLATHDVVNKARFEFASRPLPETLAVRGFDAPVACLHIQAEAFNGEVF